MLIFLESEAILNDSSLLAPRDIISHFQVTDIKSKALPTHIYINVISARNLISKDSNGKSDPFVEVFVGNEPRQQTPVISSNLNPISGIILFIKTKMFFLWFVAIK